MHALHNELNVHWIPTHTTRPMRRDDSVLSQRLFDTEANFLRHEARGEFIESIQLGSGYRYGLLREDLEKELHQNHAVIVEMTVDGATKVAKHYPNTLILFVEVDEKHRREWVQERGMTKQEIESRMKEAGKEEKAAKEQANFLVENLAGHPEEAIEAIKKIILERWPELEK